MSNDLNPRNNNTTPVFISLDIPEPPVWIDHDDPTNKVTYCNGKVSITSEIEIVNGGYTVLGGERYPLTGTMVYDHTTLEV